MKTLTIEYPDELELTLQSRADRFAEEARVLPDYKLFELGRLSSGAAARLASVPRTVFLTRLADFGVDTFRLTEEELQRETRLA